MDIRNKLPNTWRSIFKATAIYAAAAWAVIEVIDFAVSKYGLSRLLLDISVLVAFGGGMITAVLAWFHGEAGTQKVRVSEIATVLSIVLATAGGVAYFALQDPAAPFNDLDGFRLRLEFRDVGIESDGSYYFSVGPVETSYQSAEMMLNLAPDEGFFEGPSVRIEFEKHPVMFLAPSESEWVTVVFVLPFEPVELANLRKSGSFHDSLRFRTRSLSADIGARIEITEQASGATIRLVR